MHEVHGALSPTSHLPGGGAACAVEGSSREASLGSAAFSGWCVHCLTRSLAEGWRQFQLELHPQLQLGAFIGSQCCDLCASPLLGALKFALFAAAFLGPGRHAPGTKRRLQSLKTLHRTSELLQAVCDSMNGCSILLTHLRVCCTYALLQPALVPTQTPAGYAFAKQGQI